MLVGLFVRHYKIFRNINFIPVSNAKNFSSFIGPNGVGKSSILDALDKIFNGGLWSINVQAKRDGGISTDDKIPFIAPIFVVKKNQITSELSSSTAQILSDYLWDIASPIAEVKKFTDFREGLKDTFSPETHYLLCLGRTNSDAKTVSFGPFHANKIFEDADDAAPAILELYKKVYSLYTFVYVPVEIDALEFTKLESKEMTKLLDHDIQKEIEDAITKKSVRQINEKLESFLTEIQSHLGIYSYRGTHKEKLTMSDLVSKVFEAFFSIKMLHRADGPATLPINTLSSGEKRKAFVDVAYSFLKRRKKRTTFIILAMDEPDASLHVAACHDQFQRLSEIGALTDPPTQVLATTHWYGFLPIMAEGMAHSMTLSPLDERVSFDSFDLYRYREQVKHAVKNSEGKLPSDIQLKSYNDLTQSIMSSVIREDPYNWILCEGLSDKIYLEHYLKDELTTQKLRILPLGGFKEVKKVYQYLMAPLNDQEFKITGKILCLTDTDKRHVDFTPPTAPNAKFLRLVYSDKNVQIVPYGDQLKVPTEIEDALEPSSFYTTLASLIAEHYKGDRTYETLLSNNPLVPNTSNSKDCLNLRNADAELLTALFDKDDNKVRFARSYVLIDSLFGDVTPLWVSEIKQFFAPKVSAKKTLVSKRSPISSKN